MVGWGQGPTHSQNLQSWFAHIPGLKVVSPSNAIEAKGLLLSAIFDPNPVIFLEHRWLHNSISKINPNFYKIEIGSSKILTKGNDITLTANSYMIAECLDAADFLKKNYNISCELIDLRSIKPLNLNTIFNSVKKTQKILCVDTGASSFPFLVK